MVLSRGELIKRAARKRPEAIGIEVIERDANDLAAGDDARRSTDGKDPAAASAARGLRWRQRGRQFADILDQPPEEFLPLCPSHALPPRPEAQGPSGEIQTVNSRRRSASAIGARRRDETGG